jgi:hypothetical protein
MEYSKFVRGKTPPFLYLFLSYLLTYVIAINFILVILIQISDYGIVTFDFPT